MGVYAVYARPPHSTLWSLRDLFTTQGEADQHASTVVESVETEEGHAAAAVVVEWEDRTNVPAQLPAPWVAPVVSRYGEPDPTPEETSTGRVSSA
jgi:hypothetical protein